MQGDVMESINGVVERITYQNEENGYCVLKIKARSFPDLVTLVGGLGSVNLGSVIQASGEWTFDSKYGRQFSVRKYSETIPATVAGLEKYLGSGLIKGIGPVNAKRIVRWFKEDTIRVIEEKPERLQEIAGIGPKRVEMIKRAWQEQKEVKNVMMFLQEHGVSTSYAAKIFKTYGQESIQVVRENPYRLADDIWGIGFRTADRIAANMGLDPASPYRCRSGLLYLLNQMAEEGHCFSTEEQLVKGGSELLALDENQVRATLQDMVENRDLIYDEPDAYFLPSLYVCETGSANKIHALINHPRLLQSGGIDPILAGIEREYGLVYDEIQKEALKAAAAAKFMVLTGGPGTGKTTTTLGIIRMFGAMGARVFLAAPTGRAAKRMTETTGLEAKTIHRLLEYKPPGGYQKNADNPLACDVLIVDETSMVDIVLLHHLLQAVPDETAVILVGDADQLPSVGPGNALMDIIASGAVKTIRLTKIFRQAQDSMIVINAHRINKGEFPLLKGGRDSNFFFIEEEDPGRIVEEIRRLLTQRLPAYYRADPIRDIQVITPMQKGEVGARNLNEVLQGVLNPAESWLEFRGQKFKLQDKVMQIKNNYDKNVFNGDIGLIVRVDKEEKTVDIRFDNLDITYDISELDEVTLAYATTIHKSQGSEYEYVVAPLASQHYVMLQRNLLYTCVTRAKKAIILIGSRKALAIALHNNKVAGRNTRLDRRLADE